MKSKCLPNPGAADSIFITENQFGQPLETNSWSTLQICRHQEIPKIAIPRFKASSSDNLSQLLISLIDLEPLGWSLKLLGEFVDYIPQRIGNSVALDAAVSCLITSHVGYLRDDDYQLHEKHYGSSLRKLQQALCDKEERLSAETLCATLLMAWCEVGCHFLYEQANSTRSTGASIRSMLFILME